MPYVTVRQTEVLSTALELGWPARVSDAGITCFATWEEVTGGHQVIRLCAPVPVFDYVPMLHIAIPFTTFAPFLKPQAKGAVTKALSGVPCRNARTVNALIDDQWKAHMAAAVLEDASDYARGIFAAVLPDQPTLLDVLEARDVALAITDPPEP